MKNKEYLIHVSGGLSFDSQESKLNFYEKTFDIDFKNKSWGSWLSTSLSEKYICLRPNFLDAGNADYDVWKIIFEKYLAKIKSENSSKKIVLNLLGHSLGTIFLMKYLLENDLEKLFIIKGLYLISPIVDQKFQPKGDIEQTGTFAFEYEKVNELKNKVKNISIYHSTDDTMCSFKNAEFLKKELPEAKLFKFKDRGHFIDSEVFIELFLELYNSK